MSGSVNTIGYYKCASVALGKYSVNTLGYYQGTSVDLGGCLAVIILYVIIRARQWRQVDVWQC